MRTRKRVGVKSPNRRSGEPSPTYGSFKSSYIACHGSTCCIRPPRACSKGGAIVSGDFALSRPPVVSLRRNMNRFHFSGFVQALGRCQRRCGRSAKHAAIDELRDVLERGMPCFARA